MPGAPLDLPMILLYFRPKGRHSEGPHEVHPICAQNYTRGEVGMGWGGVGMGWGGVGMGCVMQGWGGSCMGWGEVGHVGGAVGHVGGGVGWVM